MARKHRVKRSVVYRVDIIEVTERPVMVGKVYQKVADSGNPRDGGAVYEWIDSPNTSTQSVERKVLTQEMGAVNIAAVIKALNGL